MQLFAAFFQELIMYRLTVLYGHPADPAAFQKYYHEVHIPLARKMKGLKGWTIGMCESTVPGEKPPYYMIVGLYTDSREDMEKILASPAGQAAVADVPKFATGGVTFIYDREEVLIPYKLDA
jgi:uncharacterized protein (TIGR02118 family)